jgi:hypothetical protein
MIERPCKDWAQFEVRLSEFLKKTAIDRRRFIFRGQSDAKWLLQTTLDRFVANKKDQDRDQVAGRLLVEFFNEAIGLGVEVPDDQTQQILFARHHGLPSPILDWSRSPFIAAFFAFLDVKTSLPKAADVAIWCVNLDAFESNPNKELLAETLEVIDDWTAIKLNPRAIEQQAVFLHVKSNIQPIETLLRDTLRKFTIPASERNAVLQRLEYMRISSRALFRTVDSAAVTAAWRTEHLMFDGATQ